MKCALGSRSSKLASRTSNSIRWSHLVWKGWDDIPSSASLPTPDASRVPCRSPAVAGKARCRMHGGALGSGAPAGECHGRDCSGQFTKKAIVDCRPLSGVIAENRASSQGILDG
jgi:hypothetical protein